MRTREKNEKKIHLGKGKKKDPMQLDGVTSVTTPA